MAGTIAAVLVLTSAAWPTPAPARPKAPHHAHVARPHPGHPINAWSGRGRIRFR